MESCCYTVREGLWASYISLSTKNHNTNAVCVSEASGPFSLFVQFKKNSIINYDDFVLEFQLKSQNEWFCGV